MTPKDKAKELFDKYKNPFNRKGCIPPNETMFDSTAKQCALIAVDEMLDASIGHFDDLHPYVNFLQQVKNEIINQ